MAKYLDETGLRTVWEKTKEKINTAVATKQDKLTAGSNITITDDGVISATGGGSGGIIIYLPIRLDESAGTVTGTAVPIDETTTIENVYFNTSLSEDKVIEIIDNAFASVADSEFITNAGTTTYVLMDQTTETMIMVMKEEGNYIIQAFGGEIENEEDAILFVSGPSVSDIIDVSFTGWNPNFNGTFAPNVTNGSLYQMTSSQGFLETLVTLNDALKSLISITPFVSRLAVPVDGTTHIENVYINTAMSVDDVKALLDANKTLFAVQDGAMSGGCILNAYNEELNQEIMIVVQVANGNYAIQCTLNNEAVMVFIDGPDASASGATFIGWNPDFDGIVPVNCPNDEEAMADVGNAETNEALKSLISITPF